MSSNIISEIKRFASANISQPIRRIAPSIEGVLRGNKISAFWYAYNNFGDKLTPLTLKYYGFSPVHYPFGSADVISIGSLLQFTPESFSGHIIGTGLIEDTARSFKKAHIWAVRGELTRKRISASKDVVLGDPGLLSSNFFDQQRKQRYTLGIIPHYVDKLDPRIVMLQKKYGKEVLVIDVQRKPKYVFRDIDQCSAIISSSLHGLIVADSFNIPNAWMSISDKIMGNGFKFHDYYSALGVKRNPIMLDGNEKLTQLLAYTCKPPEIVEEVKNTLHETFVSFRKFISNVKQ